MKVNFVFLGKIIFHCFIENKDFYKTGEQVRIPEGNYIDQKFKLLLD